jgi:hypothetical protein
MCKKFLSYTSGSTTGLSKLAGNFLSKGGAFGTKFRQTLNFLCVAAFHRKSFRDHPTTSTPASKLQKLNPKQQHLFLLL